MKKLWQSIQSSGQEKHYLPLWLAVLGLLLCVNTTEATVPPAGYPILSQSYAEYYLGTSFFQSFSPIVETRVAPVYAISLSPKGTVNLPAYSLEGNGGDTLYCTFTLRNLGNARDSLTVDYVLIPPSTVDIEDLILFYDADGDAFFDPGEEDPSFLALGLGDSTELSAAVVLPTGAYGGESYLLVYALSTGDSTPEPETSVVRVRNLDAPITLLSIGPEGNPKALPGGEGSSDDITQRVIDFGRQVVTFQNDILNEDGSPDVIQISLADSTNLPDGVTVSFVDSVGNAFPLLPYSHDAVLLGFVSAGEQRTIDVRVTSATEPLHSLFPEPFSIGIVVRSLLDTLRINGTIDRLIPAQDINPAAMITLEQTFKENVASMGDVVTFTATVRNINDSVRVDDVIVSEKIQPALNFLRSPGFERQGGKIVWRVGRLNGGEERKTVVKFLANSRVHRGWTKVFGRATGIAETGEQVYTGPAVSALRIENSPVMTEGVILGEVFIDENGDLKRSTGEEGIPGAAVYLEDGTFAVTDSTGKFSLPGIFSGYRILRLDEASLPPFVASPIPSEETSSVGAAGPGAREIQKDQQIEAIHRPPEGWRIVHLIPGGHAVVSFPLRRKPLLSPRETTLVRNISCQEKVSIQKCHNVLFEALSVESSHFPTGKTYLKPGVIASLKPVPGFLLSHPGWKVLIEGHTDSIPVQNTKNFKSNDELSLERARAVKRYLVANGIGRHLIFTRGYGKTRPIATNSTALGRSRNRRVELSFVPPGVSLKDEAALKRVKAEMQSIETIPDTFQVRIIWEFITDSPIPRDVSLEVRVPERFPDREIKVGYGGQPVAPRGGLYPIKAFARSSGIRCEVVFRTDEEGKASIRETAAVLFCGAWRVGVKKERAQPGGSTGSVREKGFAVQPTDSILVQPFMGGKSTEDTKVYDLVSWREQAPENHPATEAAESAPFDGEPTIVSTGAVEGKIKITPNERLETDSTSTGRSDTDNWIFGILSPEDGHLYTRKNRIPVRARIPLGSRFELYAGGLPVSRKQIGEKKIHLKQGFEEVTWYGAEIQSGWNQIRLHAVHVDGTHFEDSIQVALASSPRVLEAARSRLMIPADGRTQENVRFTLRDNMGCPVADGFVATVIAGDSIVSSPDESPHQRGLQITSRDGYFVVHIKPSRRTGRNKIVLEYEELSASCDVAFIPSRRPLFISGIINTKLGFFGTSGSGSPLGLEDYYDGARLKSTSRLFLQGTSYGGMNLTARLDTRKRFKDPYSPSIEPDKQYAIYGDASELCFAAPSQGGNYIALEKDESFVRYGDFRTPLSEGEFLRYERAATGINAALTHRENAFKAFLTKSDFATVKDELRGDGTSGYYYLSRSPVVEHSEKITVETRDRYQPERILDVRPLARNRDFTINYFDGAVLFKSPIPVTDEAFNPAFIVVIYEVRTEDEANYVYGLRGELAESHRVRIGASAVTRGSEGQRYVLYGIDGNISFGGFNLSGEIARSEDDVSGNSNAFKVEAAFKNDFTDNSVYLRRVDGNFLNPSFSGGAHELATLKVGYQSRLHVTNSLSFESQGFRHRLEQTGEDKESADALFKLSRPALQLSAGVRGARHEVQDQQKKGILALAGIGAGNTEGPTFSMDLEKNLRDESVENYPDRLKTLLGAPFLGRYRFRANHEYRTASGCEGTHQATAGVESKVGGNGTVYTKYSMNRTASNERVGAVTGLKHKVKIRRNLFGSFDVENFHSLSEDHESDYFALKTGLGTLEKGAHLLEGQYEYRWAKEQRKHLLRLNALAEFEGGISLLLKNAFAFSENADNKEAVSNNSRLACAYRPVVSPVKVLGFIKSGYNRLTPVDPEAITWKLVFSTDLNLIPAAAHELRLKYAIKRVEDYSPGISLTNWSQLVLSQYIYYFRELWDVDVWGRVLAQGEGGTLEIGSGIEVGRLFYRSIRLSAGYSINGFEERDLSENDAWAKGFSLRVQFILSDWILREMGLY